MKIVYLVIVILILYAAVSYGRFVYITSHAHLQIFHQPDQTLGQGPKLKYIAAGDSTAVGEGASSTDNTYTAQLKQYFAQTHTVDYKNVAVGGSTTQDVIDKQLSSIIAFNPDVITISIGANDVTHLKSVTEIIANDKIIIDQLTEKTKAKIYITDVPTFSSAFLLPWPVREYFDHEAKVANLQLLKLGTDRVKFVDIHSIVVNNAADQFHPSDAGYKNWTNKFLSVIKTNN